MRPLRLQGDRWPKQHRRPHHGARVTVVAAHLNRRQYPTLNLGHRVPRGTRPPHITPAWALWDPGGTSTSRTSTGAQGDQRRPPPGFPEMVDLTPNEKEMDDRGTGNPPSQRQRQ